MKAIYFEEPVDQFSCVERAWRERLNEDDGRAIFLRSRPGTWSSQARFWSIKYVLEGRGAFETDGHECEVYAGFCFVIPEDTAYRSMIRDGRALSIFGRSLAGACPESAPCVSGVFALTEKERQALQERVESLQGLRGNPGGASPDQGIEVQIDQRFPLPRAWQELSVSMRSWMQGGPARLRTARRLLAARHFLTAGFRDHDICARAAEEASMTRSHFSRQFSALFGQSPRQYLVEYRTAVAQSLLRSGRMTVEQVAARLGYGHPSSLAHLFQRRDLGRPRNILAEGAKAAITRGGSR